MSAELKITNSIFSNIYLRDFDYKNKVANL